MATAGETWLARPIHPSCAPPSTSLVVGGSEVMLMPAGNCSGREKNPLRPTDTQAGVSCGRPPPNTAASRARSQSKMALTTRSHFW